MQFISIKKNYRIAEQNWELSCVNYILGLSLKEPSETICPKRLEYVA